MLNVLAPVFLHAKACMCARGVMTSPPSLPSNTWFATWSSKRRRQTRLRQGFCISAAIQCTTERGMATTGSISTYCRLYVACFSRNCSLLQCQNTTGVSDHQIGHARRRGRTSKGMAFANASCDTKLSPKYLDIAVCWRLARQ